MYVFIHICHTHITTAIIILKEKENKMTIENPALLRDYLSAQPDPTAIPNRELSGLSDGNEGHPHENWSQSCLCSSVTKSTAALCPWPGAL